MSEKKKKIVHIISGLGIGGAETMLYRLVQSLHGHDGHEHAVITLTGNCDFDFGSLGVPVEIIDLRKPFGLISGLVRLRQVIRKHQPDVIQAWMYHANVAATLFGPSGIPVAWGIHHSLHDLKNEKVSVRLLIKAGAFLSKWKNIQKIVYVSGKSQIHHSAYGYSLKKSTVIPNGFDCRLFAPDEAIRLSSRCELGFNENDVLIGNFGRYHPVKDHPLLLRAFAAISNNFPNAYLLLAGTGMSETNEYLVDLIGALGVTHRVRLLGPRNDMPKLYNALDLYALSSKSESFPNVLGEASACGVPSITTDVGDSCLIVSGTGRIVPPADFDALYRELSAMTGLKPHQRRSLGVLARKHVVDRFGLPVVARAYADMYDELIEINRKT